MPTGRVSSAEVDNNPAPCVRGLPGSFPESTDSELPHVKKDPCVTSLLVGRYQDNLSCLRAVKLRGGRVLETCHCWIEFYLTHHFCDITKEMLMSRRGMLFSPFCLCFPLVCSRGIIFISVGRSSGRKHGSL